MSNFVFTILDELIEELSEEENHSGKKVRVINRITGLRNSAHQNLMGKSYYRFHQYNNLKREYERIMSRFYDNDIPGVIEMMRELQDDVAVWNDEVVYGENRSAWYRFADWRAESLR